MPTATTPDLINFNEGEALEHQDLIDIGRMADRKLLDHLVRRLMWNPGDDGHQLRPIGPALSVDANGLDMDLSLNVGSVLWALGAPPGQPGASYILHDLTAAMSITGISVGDGTNPRIDIISAKLEYENGNAESRDQKSAVGRTITTQSVDKRRRTKLTVTYTEGTPAGSPSEPSPPAGEVVIARVDVATGVVLLNDDDITDRRVPAGYSRIYVGVRDWLNHSSPGWGQLPPFGWSAATATPGDLLSAVLEPPVHQPEQTLNSGPGVIEHANRHVRLATIRLAYNLNTGGGATFKLRRGGANDGTGLTDVLDLSGSLTSSTLTQTLLTLNKDNPIWVNGLANPRDKVTDDWTQLYAEVRAQTIGTDKIYGLWAEFWGM